MSSLSEEALPFFSLSQSISLIVCRCWNMAVLVCPWKSWVWCWESLWMITPYAWLMCLPCRSQERWVKNVFATRGVRLTISDLSFYIYVYLSISIFPFQYFTRTASSFNAVWEKLIFSSSTEAYFNHAVITARRLVRVGFKKMNQSTVVACEPMAMQPAKIGGPSGYIISCSATASQISSKKATEACSS